MKPNDPILEKLKKLLRMKRGGTPEEIATALRLAQKLAQDNGIDLSSVDPDAEPPRPIGHESTHPKARLQWEEKYAAMICDRWFNVSAFIHEKAQGHCVTFVGTEVDRRIASYVHHFLVGHFRREWKTRHGRIRNRQAFMYGMYIGVNSKLRERQPNRIDGDPLAVALLSQEKARDAYIAGMPGKSTAVEIRPDGKATASMNSGFEAGRKTEIRQGVETSRATALIG